MPQDPSTLPATQHEAITGGHAEDDLRQQAHQAGEINLDPLHPCRACGVYQAGDLNNDALCEACITNPEPDRRSLAGLSQEVVNLGCHLKGLAAQMRLAEKVGLEDIYSKQFSLGLVDLWRVGEELDRRNPHPNMTAEQLAGELGVGQHLKEGGQ